MCPRVFEYPVCIISLMTDDSEAGPRSRIGTRVVVISKKIIDIYPLHAAPLKRK